MIAKPMKYWAIREISHGWLFDLNSFTGLSDGRSVGLRPDSTMPGALR